MTADTITGRGWAYLGAVLGGAVSVAANVAHSYVPPATLPAGENPSNWSPEPGAVLSAVIWPVFLFVAIEILVRIPWPDGRRWQLVRFGGLLPVALVAAVVSYRHMSGLLAHYGEDGLIVAIGPLAVDGLMIMAAGALVATSTAAVVPVTQDGPELVPARPHTAENRQDEDQDEAVTVARPADYPRPALPADLLDRARTIAARHANDTGGRLITRDALRAELGVSNGLASDVLAAIRQDDTPPAAPVVLPVPISSPPVLTGPVNGHRPS